MYFTDCLSKNIDNVVVLASLLISVYLFPSLLGLILKIKHNNIEFKCLPPVQGKIIAPAFQTTFKYILNLWLCAIFPGQKLYYQNNLRLKSIILLIFPLFHLVTRFLTVFLLSCPFPKIFVKFLCNIKKNINKANKTLNTTTLRLASLSILLIVLCNPSILNPGPTKLSGIKCYFQNVQGLVTFSSLGKLFPNLNQTKISELQEHIFETSPDIVILNETWLNKPTIKSNEILPTNIYIIFRLNRATASHPPDHDYPQKFTRNGGGVLIGIKRSLDLNPKLVNQSCSAEVLSVQLSLPNKEKICLLIVYRVGTLGTNNFFQLQKHHFNLIIK